MSTLGASVAGSVPTSPTTNYHVSCLEHMSDVREMASRLRQQAADLYKELHGTTNKEPQLIGGPNKVDGVEKTTEPDGFFATSHAMLNAAADSLKETMAILNNLH